MKRRLITVGLVLMGMGAGVQGQSVDIGAGATVTTSPQPVPQPQTIQEMADTIAWLYQQLVNVQTALSNQQQQLTTVENNSVLGLGQFVSRSTAIPAVWLPGTTFTIYTPAGKVPKLVVNSAGH